jgi:hypothetical protein
MKVVVARWDDGEPIYNPGPAGHGGPKTKGKVERPFYFAGLVCLNILFW